MSVYLTGDTHGDLTMNKLSSKNWPVGRTLGADDYVIILGDFGLIWYPEEDNDKTEKYWLDWLDAKPWTTLFIDGNHENFERLDAMPETEWHGGHVHRVSEKVFHLMRGEIYDICGNSFLAFGGAQSPDRAFRTEGIDWWIREEPSEEEREHCLANLLSHDNHVDVVLTHDAPIAAYDMLSTVIQYPPASLCYWMQTNIVEKAHFKRWYFGHHHRDLVSPRYVCLYDDIVKLDLSCADGAAYRVAWEQMLDEAALEGGGL